MPCHSVPPSCFLPQSAPKRFCSDLAARAAFWMRCALHWRGRISTRPTFSSSCSMRPAASPPPPVSPLPRPAASLGVHMRALVGEDIVRPASGRCEG